MWRFKSNFAHLRFKFVAYLIPVFLFALSCSKLQSTGRVILTFVVLHGFLYPASNAYNSFYDRDEKSIGGLEHPPQITSELKTISYALDFVALVLAIRMGAAFFGMVLIYGFISKAYSHPIIRLKKRPFLSWIIVSIFQGAWIFYAVQIGVGSHIDYAAGAVATLLVASSYPLTQIYQFAEDQKRGDLTLSRWLGIRGTFVFSALLLLVALVAMIICLSHSYARSQIAWLPIFLMPVGVHFFSWMIATFRDSGEANYKNANRMSFFATWSMSSFFVFLLLMPRT